MSYLLIGFEPVIMGAMFKICLIFSSGVAPSLFRVSVFFQEKPRVAAIATSRWHPSRRRKTHIFVERIQSKSPSSSLEVSTGLKNLGFHSTPSASLNLASSLCLSSILNLASVAPS